MPWGTRLGGAEGPPAPRGALVPVSARARAGGHLLPVGAKRHPCQGALLARRRKVPRGTCQGTCNTDGAKEHVPRGTLELGGRGPEPMDPVKPESPKPAADSGAEFSGDGLRPLGPASAARAGGAGCNGRPRKKIKRSPVGDGRQHVVPAGRRPRGRRPSQRTRRCN